MSLKQGWAVDLVNEIMVRPPHKRKGDVLFTNFSSTVECRYKRKVGLRELELATVFIMQYKVNLREKYQEKKSWLPIFLSIINPKLLNVFQANMS